jgi:hypothetical protein
LWSNWWNEDWQGKPKYSEKTCPSATLSTTNPTWPDPGSNPGRRNGKPVTNRWSNGAALVHTKWDSKKMCRPHESKIGQSVVGHNMRAYGYLNTPSIFTALKHWLSMRNLRLSQRLTTKTTVWWDMTQFRLAETYLNVLLSSTIIYRVVPRFLLTATWWCQVPPKCYYLFTKLHRFPLK